MADRIEVGDVVVWDLDAEVNRDLSDEYRKHGPFVVIEQTVMSNIIKRLDGAAFDNGKDKLIFWQRRFRRDEFLTAVRRAKASHGK